MSRDSPSIHVPVAAAHPVKDRARSFVSRWLWQKLLLAEQAVTATEKHLRMQTRAVYLPLSCAIHCGEHYMTFCSNHSTVPIRYGHSTGLQLIFSDSQRNPDIIGIGIPIISGFLDANPDIPIRNPCFEKVCKNVGKLGGRKGTLDRVYH